MEHVKSKWMAIGYINFVFGRGRVQIGRNDSSRAKGVLRQVYKDSITVAQMTNFAGIPASMVQETS